MLVIARGWEESVFAKRGSGRQAVWLSKRSAQVVGLGLVTGAVLAFSLPATAAAAPKAGGKTLYVSPTGSDSGNCMKKAPCQTIGHAVALARKNAAVMVATGSYAEDVTITKRV